MKNIINFSFIWPVFTLILVLIAFCLIRLRLICLIRYFFEGKKKCVIYQPTSTLLEKHCAQLKTGLENVIHNDFAQTRNVLRRAYKIFRIAFLLSLYNANFSKFFMPSCSSVKHSESLSSVRHNNLILITGFW